MQCRSYYTIVSLGNMSFRVALDTGSSDFWLMSSACTTSTCSSLPRYQLAYGSSTFESVNKNDTLFNVSYADSTCEFPSALRVLTSILCVSLAVLEVITGTR